MAVGSPVIQTDQLTKSYPARGGAKLALKALNLTVNPGEIFGYLGPNGAGKTTTIRILLDIIRPDRGSATLLGMQVRRDRVALHRRVGYLPGELSLWSYLTGREVVRYISQIKGVYDAPYIRHTAERLLLDLDKRVRDYSSGNRRKLGILLALMHHPDLLILDEPTNGLDPLMQQTFYHLVREARDEGRTIFLSSHILSEVQSICDRVGILRDGELKAVQRVDDLIHADFRWVTISLRRPLPALQLENLPGVSQFSVLNGGDKVRFRLVGALGAALQVMGTDEIVDVLTEKPSLEEVFLTFYGDVEQVQSGEVTTQ